MEEYYIWLYDSRNNSVGYNISHGGRGGNTGNYSGHSKRFSGKNNPQFEKSQNAETKKKQRISISKWLSTPAGIKQREEKRSYFSSDDNPGKNKSKLTRNKLSIAKKGQKVSPLKVYTVTDPDGIKYTANGERNLDGLCKYVGISAQILKKKQRTGIEYKGGTAGWSLTIKQK